MGVEGEGVTTLFETLFLPSVDVDSLGPPALPVTSDLP